MEGAAEPRVGRILPRWILRPCSENKGLRCKGSGEQLPAGLHLITSGTRGL